MKTTILRGDCLERLRELPDESVHCCVTSPPYYGLRDYGVSGQLGLEPTLDAYLAKMVEVFREVRRVLRPDGTLWLNIGDSYATDGGPGWQGKNGERSNRRFTGTRNTVAMREQSRTAMAGFKPKDLMGVPWRLAFALQADGWWLRQDIIWHKPNPMPESVTDRCTKAHEYIFLMAKSERYFYDADAVMEPVQSVKGNSKSFRGGGCYTGGNSFNNHTTGARETHGNVPNEDGVRNKRSVWTVATSPFKEAHFATFPQELIKPCIMAGCPEGGTVLDPFFGSGTTGLVAGHLQRDCIGIELNPTYADMAERRILGDAPLFAEVA